MSKEGGKLSGNLLNFQKILNLVWSVDKSNTTVLLVLTQLEAFSPIILAWLGKLIIDGIIAYQNGEQVQSEIEFAFLIMALFVLLRQIVIVVSQTAQDALQENIKCHISALVVEKAANLNVIDYEIPEKYDLIHRARQESEYRPVSMIQQVLVVISRVISLISLVVILAQINYFIVLLVVATSVPVFIIESYYGSQNYFIQRQQSPKNRKITYLGSILTTKQFVKEIRIFRLADRFIQEFIELLREVSSENRKQSLRRNWGSFAFQIISLAGYYGVYFYIIRRVLLGEITVGELTMYTGMIISAQNFLRDILVGLARLAEQSMFVGNLFEFLNSARDERVESVENLTSDIFTSDITLEKVCFQYPGNEGFALDEVNLRIEAGEKLAIVGENGAGKSTLVNLLLQLYNPSSGKIYFDGVNAREISLEKIRGMFSVIFQDFSKYHFTALENIGFGDINRVHERELVISAGKKGGADSFIAKLRKGYDTNLGRWFDDTGTDLSIGQWQKVALSRLFMSEASFLIFDEPTAALDPKSESEFLETLKTLSSGKTVIIISHRLSTVRFADKIIVMKRGKIIESGSHLELLHAGGEYAMMYDLQKNGLVK